MTTLFRRIKPAQKFHITKRQIAKFLRIPESLIVKIESWLYVLFVNRTDKGGQFISYRQMEQWKNAVACQIQKCSTWQHLEHLWNAIVHDHIKHNCQYDNSVFPFVEKIWTIQAVQTVIFSCPLLIPNFLPVHSQGLLVAVLLALYHQFLYLANIVVASRLRKM